MNVGTKKSLDSPMLTFLPNFSLAFVQMDHMNVSAKFAVHSFTHSWDNSDWSFGWGLRTRILGKQRPYGSEMLPFERTLVGRVLFLAAWHVIIYWLRLVNNVINYWLCLVMFIYLAKWMKFLLFLCRRDPDVQQSGELCEHNHRRCRHWNDISRVSTLPEDMWSLMCLNKLCVERS